MVLLYFFYRCLSFTFKIKHIPRSISGTTWPVWPTFHSSSALNLEVSNSGGKGERDRARDGSMSAQIRMARGARERGEMIATVNGVESSQY